jgi:molecular chaperone GrpE
VGKDERDNDQKMNGEMPEEATVDETELDSGETGDEQDVIEKLIAQRDEYLDQLQRSRAEFINYRKRTEAERTRLGEVVTANTLAQFLPVLDDFDRAMTAVPNEEREGGWVSGITMIHKKLQALLERAGVREVPGVNEPFDPAFHEAVASDPGSSGEAIAEVYQKGYILGDTLLRAAMVKTGDKVDEPADASEETENAEA